MRKTLITIIAAALMLSGCGETIKELNKPSSGTASEPPAESAQVSSETEEDEESKEDEEAGLTPIYDTSEIVRAYRENDPSGLSDKDAAIYEAAVKAFEEINKDGQNLDDAVIAAHDWVTTHVTYDTNMLAAIPNPREDSENPYGALINGQAICMGYTTTFKIFMDFLGVENVIVRGEALDEEHAWNMVKLDGNWYHVDCTWDDFVPDEPGRMPFHTYLFVTDSVMDVEHIWNHETAPKADSDDKNYFKANGLYAKSSFDSGEIVAKIKNEGGNFAEIMTDDISGITFANVIQYWPIDLGDYTVTIYWL